MINKMEQGVKKLGIRSLLLVLDFAVYLVICIVIMLVYKGAGTIKLAGALIQTCIGTLAIFGCRIGFRCYKQIWRYGGVQCYIRLLLSDGLGLCLFTVASKILPFPHLTFAKIISITTLNLLAALTMRLFYRYAYKCGNSDTEFGRFLLKLLSMFGRSQSEWVIDITQSRVAILGAGRLGVSLAEELLNNPGSQYKPCCFIDINDEKAGREIHELPVFLEKGSFAQLKKLDVETVIFAVPGLDTERKKELYKLYKDAGYRVKVYDYPVMQSAGKRLLREFDAEELLFRKPIIVVDEAVKSYYKNKTILITGGGGSIGSELCRQIAAMNPKKIIILDIYENGAYDVQQELKIKYKSELNISVEIASITNALAMERVFEYYRPEIVINAAAHKHVPLMEHNCIEAIENNVFGCKVVVDLCEKYGAKRFMMVSTDKAVNPTNVMGATKRMCEMLVLSGAKSGKVKYSCTRFGNVLGSAGSVIPLFKRQIAAGGPVTVTDKRIIRYFMTIPEASQLVLASGAMAHNGELFVLDMGQPVKIYDLAENMIRLSGASGIEIIETGLRPGEKLYEELLVKTEELEKTDNNLIFIERDEPLDSDAINEKLNLLRKACDTGSDDEAREALRKAVPTFVRPEEINNTVK